MDFQPTVYGPEVARILALDGRGQRLGPLVCDRRTPQAARQALASYGARDLFPAAAEPGAPMAGLWLYFSGFDEAHALVDDPLTSDGAYWHAIVHRQEPDDANAEYWFRQVGAHPVFDPLAEDAAEILQRYPDVAWNARPWDPFAFVELCARARRRPECAEERAAREIQKSGVANSVRSQREATLKTGIALSILALAVLGGGAWYAVTLRNRPPEVPFTRVTRETIESTVPTNGKVEPIEWAEAHTERSGPVAKILVQRGERVTQGAPLIELDTSEIAAELAAAQSRIAQAHAELEVLNKGGRAVELASIASDLEHARQELATARRESDTLVRLEAKQAATRNDVTQAKDRVERAELQIRALENRRAALVSPPDRSSAEARLRDAEAAASLAQERIRKSVVRAPLAGTLYQFDLKPGAYLNAGDLVATVGQLDRVRVKVFVDEPDLGRVAARLPVTITWDALPGRQWKGSVDRTPTQIVALGTRQVGEVLCVIENPKNDLLPGTNVNADIRTDAAEGVLTIAKEAIRREAGEPGVFVLTGQTVAWKKIKLGIGSTTRSQVEGLNEGDAVALPSERPLKDGMIVTPVFP